MKVGSSRRAYQESAAALYPDAASGRDYTSIVNPRDYARLQGLIEDARARPLETSLGQVLDATPDFDRNGSYYETNLGASWELDVFGGLQRGREAARAAISSFRALGGGWDARSVGSDRYGALQ